MSGSHTWSVPALTPLAHMDDVQAEFDALNADVAFRDIVGQAASSGYWADRIFTDNGYNLLYKEHTTDWEAFRQAAVSVAAGILHPQAGSEPAFAVAKQQVRPLVTAIVAAKIGAWHEADKQSQARKPVTA